MTEPNRDAGSSIETPAREISRRDFLQQTAVTGTVLATCSDTNMARGDMTQRTNVGQPESVPTVLQVNGRSHELQLDPRATLLDVLREQLHLTGTKKGCDHGQCGACTVLANGRRVYSCLSLAVSNTGAEITTIEGLANGDELHPMQQAFIERDAFQCGYCTSGQICSAVGLLNEGRAKTEAEIRELMSGNLCRCGAYLNIVNAIRDVQARA
jgi:xanthine dehydrogenase YagT iron-sulfur-binding subunit